MTEKRLRVATVVTRLEAGAGVVALRGAQALDPQVYDPIIIAGSGDRLINDAEAAGITVIIEPQLRPTIALTDDLRGLRALRGLFDSIGPDVVHTHSSKAGALGRVAANLVSVPRVVHTYHGFPFHQFQSRARRAAYIAIERRLGRITDVALCVGTGVAAEAARRRIVSPERIRTVGVTVENEPWVQTSTSRSRARTMLGVPQDRAVVGAVGRLTYQKAPEDFVAALVAMNRPDVVGVWVGSGPLADRVNGLARAALPRAHIMFVGERSDVAELLPAFDVFALPSRYEGLPVAIVEAMKSGIPVAGTAVNSVSDVVIPGETGLLVPAGKPRVMARAIRYLLDNPAQAQRMASTAQDRIRNRHQDHLLGSALADAYGGTLPHTGERQCWR